MRKVLVLLTSLLGSFVALVALAGSASAATAIEYGLIAALIAVP